MAKFWRRKKKQPECIVKPASTYIVAKGAAGIYFNKTADFRRVIKSFLEYAALQTLEKILAYRSKLINKIPPKRIVSHIWFWRVVQVIEDNASFAGSKELHAKCGDKFIGGSE